MRLAKREVKIVSEQDVPQSEQLWVVRLYDGFDNEWMDITKPLTRSEADRVWNEKTANGTKKRNYQDIDYYAIRLADTNMANSTESGLVPTQSGLEPVEPVEASDEYQELLMGGAADEQSSEELKTPADLTQEYQYRFVESPQPLTIAQAYSQLDKLMPKDSFQLNVEIWKWHHMSESEQLVVTYRCYCVEHGTAHGGQEHPNLESVLRAVIEAHSQEMVSEGDSRFEALRDIGELDREQSGGGPNL